MVRVMCCSPCTERFNRRGLLQKYRLELKTSSRTSEYQKMRLDRSWSVVVHGRSSRRADWINPGFLAFCFHYQHTNTISQPLSSYDGSTLSSPAVPPHCMNFVQCCPRTRRRRTGTYSTCCSNTREVSSVLHCTRPRTICTNAVVLVIILCS